MNFTTFSIEADHFSDPVAEVVVGGMREIINRIAAHVQSTRRDFMQVRLPDVSSGAFDQGDLSLPAPPQGVAQLGRKLKTGSASADNDDVMERGLGRPHPGTF